MKGAAASLATAVPSKKRGFCGPTESDFQDFV